MGNGEAAKGVEVSVAFCRREDAGANAEYFAGKNHFERTGEKKREGERVEVGTAMNFIGKTRAVLAKEREQFVGKITQLQ